MLNNFLNIPITQRKINNSPQDVLSSPQDVLIDSATSVDSSYSDEPVVTQRGLNQERIIGDILTPVNYLQNNSNPNSVLFNNYYSPNLSTSTTTPTQRNFSDTISNIVNNIFFPAAGAAEVPTQQAQLDYGQVVLNREQTNLPTLNTSNNIINTTTPILRGQVTQDINRTGLSNLGLSSEGQVESTIQNQVNPRKAENLQFTETINQPTPEKTVDNLKNTLNDTTRRFIEYIAPYETANEVFIGGLGQVQERAQEAREEQAPTLEELRRNRIHPDFEQMSLGQFLISPISNFGHDTSEMGTGLVSSMAGLLGSAAVKLGLPHDEDDEVFAKELENSVGDWMYGTTPLQKGEDIYNLFLGSALNSNDIKQLANSGNLNPVGVTGVILRNLYEHPLYATLDLVPALGVGKNAIKGLASAGKLSRAAKLADTAGQIGGKPSQLAQIVTDVTRADVARSMDTLGDDLKILKDAKIQDLTKVVEAGELGLELTPDLIPLRNTLKRFGEKYHELVKRFAPHNVVDPKQTAITQFIARKLKTTYEDASRLVTPYFENSEIFNRPAIYKNNNAINQLYEHVSSITGLGKEELIERFGKLKVVIEEGYNPDNILDLGVVKGDIVTLYRDAIKDVGETIEQTLRHELTHIDTKWLEYLSAYNTNAMDYIKDLKRALRPNDKNPLVGMLSFDEQEKISYALDKIVNPKTFIPPEFQDIPQALTNLMKQEFFQKISNAELKLTKEAASTLKDGSNLDKLILQANEAFDRGIMYPITHAGADTLESIVETLGDNARKVKYSGRFSERIVGTATYADIAKALKNPSNWLDQNLNSFTESSIINQMEKGLLSSTKNTKNIGFVTIDDLKNTNKVSDISILTEKPVGIEAISIDIDTLKRIEDRLSLGRGDNPFKNSFLKDAWSLTKNTALGQGLYLAGNFGTALNNALLDSNINLGRNIAQALGSKGQLTRLAGLRRNIIRSAGSNFETPFLKNLDIYSGNKLIRTMLGSVDASIQNFASEVSLHNRLLSERVPVSQRAQYIKELVDTDKIKLADIINDTARVAAMPAQESIIPRAYRGAVAIGSGQFWGWMEDAARSTIHTYKKHPILSNVIYHHILGELGYNQEMQHRFNIRADKDKPFVHIKFNPKTGGFRETSIETAPQMNTLKVASGLIGTAVNDRRIGDMENLGSGANLLLNTLINSTKGLDRYGRPIQRYYKNRMDKVYVDQYSKKRYKWEQGEGLTQLGVQPDEVLNAALTNMVSLVNLTNNTILPIGGVITGRSYFKPSGNMLFGSFDPNEYVPILVGGDPSREVTPADIMTRLMGGYTANYYNESGQPKGRGYKQIIRSGRARERRNINTRRQF